MERRVRRGRAQIGGHPLKSRDINVRRETRTTQIAELDQELSELDQTETLAGRGPRGLHPKTKIEIDRRRARMSAQKADLQDKVAEDEQILEAMRRSRDLGR